jgi:hypothetical protein
MSTGYRVDLCTLLYLVRIKVYFTKNSPITPMFFSKFAVFLHEVLVVRAQEQITPPHAPHDYHY